MAQPGQVEVEGLAEFRRALNQVDRELGKELRRTMKSEVAQPVAQRVRSRVPVRSGAWRKEIKPFATARAAGVQWGRAKVPYAAWMEFGGGIPNKRNRTGSPRISRKFLAGGRYVHPTVEESASDALGAAQGALDAVMRRAQLVLD